MNSVANWKIVENGTAVNFDQVTSISVSRYNSVGDSYNFVGDNSTISEKPWYVVADKVLIKSGFKTQAAAVKEVKKLVDELTAVPETNITVTPPVGITGEELTRSTRAFPGVDSGR